MHNLTFYISVSNSKDYGALDFTTLPENDAQSM